MDHIKIIATKNAQFVWFSAKRVKIIANAYPVSRLLILLKVQLSNVTLAYR